MWENLKKFFAKNKRFVSLSCVMLVIWFFMWISYKEHMHDDVVEITYNEFIESCEAGDVDAIYYDKTSEYMRIALFNDETRDMSLEDLKEYEYENTDMRRVLYPSYDEFRKDMLAYGVRLVIESNTTVADVLSTILSLAFPLIWLAFIWRMMSSQIKGLDKNLIMQTSTVTFDDVIGQDEILDDVRFITKLIKDPELGKDMGVKTPKGVLLTGPPGVGKTLIAKAIAGESGVPFISISGSDFKEMYVGTGAKRVRELFKIAKAHTPCIIFIDEIDSIGASRNSHQSNIEDDQTINALLKEMDGFSERKGIFILAATNHPEKLDPAIIRSGRFDRRITINPPRDWRVRKQLFMHYLDDVKLSEEVDLETFAKTVSGFTGADIEMVCNEAGIVALMKEKACIDIDCLEEAIDKKIFNGNRSKSESFKKDKEIVAYHEAGHAVMRYLLNEPMTRASIIGTTSGVGGAVFVGDKDTCFTTNVEIIHHVMSAFGGRASEAIKFETLTTGASNDILQATSAMRSYIEEHGFDDEFGLLNVSVLREHNLIDNTEILNRVSSMSKRLYQDTLDMLKKNFNMVEVLAQRLLEVESMSGPEIYELLQSAIVEDKNDVGAE